MKKILFLLCFFMLTGCVSQSHEEKNNFDLYNQVKNNLLNQTNFDEEYNFNISVVYNQMDDDYRYDIIIDKPSEAMYDIMAMSYASEVKEQMCPSIGIFDDKTYHLKENFIDKANGYYKGVQLSGTTLEKKNIKVYIKYYRDEARKESVEKYIEVKQ